MQKNEFFDNYTYRVCYEHDIDTNDMLVSLIINSCTVKMTTPWDDLQAH